MAERKGEEEADAWTPSACVFDLDGTLLDTEPIYFQAYQKAAESYGHTYTWQDTHRLIQGKAELEGAHIVVDVVGLDVTPEQFLERRDTFLNDLMRKAEALPGALAVVKHMKASCDKIALATSSYSQYLDFKRENNAEMLALFDVIICGDNPKIGKGKPEPDIFLTAAEAIGADPKACLAFEDSAAGVASAHAAGMHVVAIPDPRLPASLFAKATVVLESLTQFDPTQFGLAAMPDAAPIDTAPGASAAAATTPATGPTTASDGAAAADDA